MGKKETWSGERDRRRERRAIRRDEKRAQREGLPSSQVSDPDVPQDRSSQVIGMGNGSHRGVNRFAFLEWGNPDAHQETPEERMALEAVRPLQERLFEVHGPSQGNEAEDSELHQPAVTPTEQLRDLLRQRRTTSPLWDDDK